jgi:hypothetical protein
LEFLFDDSNEAIGDDGNMNLDANSILGFTPKGFDTQMLFDPFEKKFDLPPIAIKQGYMLGWQVEVVCVVREGAMQVLGIENYASDNTRIIFFVPFACEPDCLVEKDSVCTIKNILSINNFVFWAKLFSNDEEGHRYMNDVKSGEVKVASVKYITGIWLVSEPIHCIDIVYDCVGDSVEYGYLRHDVNLRMYFDARLSAAKLCPIENRHAEIDGRGINGVESSMQFELLSDA